MKQSDISLIVIPMMGRAADLSNIAEAVVMMTWITLFSAAMILTVLLGVVSPEG